MEIRYPPSLLKYNSNKRDTALILGSVVVKMISSSIKCKSEMWSIFKTNNLLVKKHTFEPGMSMNVQHRYANVVLSLFNVL